MNYTLITSIQLVVVLSTATGLATQTIASLCAKPLPADQKQVTAAEPTKKNSSTNANAQTKIPWQLRDNEEGDTEQDRQERKQFEKDIEQDGLQILAISTAVVNNSRETQKLIEKAERQMHFQGSIQAESLARDIIFPPQEPPAPVDSRMLISMLHSPRGVDQWTAIQLYQRVRDAIDQATKAYREYSAASHRVYRSTSSLNTLEKVVKECGPTYNPAEHIEMDTILEKAKIDLQEVTAKRSQARQTIVELAGEGVACGVDERLKVAERGFQRNR